MPSLSLKPRETQIRLLRFIVVGGGSALLQLAIVAVLKRYMGETLAFSISWFLSAAVHYLANRFWALPSSRVDIGKQFGEYLFTLALSYAINLGAFMAFRHWVGMNVEWATLCAIPPSTIVVFLMLNYRVFKVRAETRGP
jgi:putative flippase GtrA